MKSANFQIGNVNKSLIKKLDEKNTTNINNIKDNEEKKNVINNTNNTSNQSNKPKKIVENVYYFN